MLIDFLAVKNEFESNPILKNYLEYINQIKEDYKAQIIRGPLEKLTESEINIFRGCVINMEEIFDFDKLNQQAVDLESENNVANNIGLSQEDPI